jgi:solute carrier family 35 protein E3
LGVCVVSVTDFQLNLIGSLIALSGVFAGSFYQIWVGTKQKELGVNSMQLLYYQSFISMVILTVAVPLIDDAVALYNYQFTTQSVSWILFSAFLAFFVNLSTFLIIGKTSPVTYNMVGHFKLCVILLLGFVIFAYPVDYRQVLGISVTLGGLRFDC